MNEILWSSCRNPRWLISHICDGTEAWKYRCRASKRTLRLIACAISRRLLGQPWSHKVASIEDLADIPDTEWPASHNYICADPIAEFAIDRLLIHAERRGIYGAVCHIIRDIIGNPFNRLSLCGGAFITSALSGRCIDCCNLQTADVVSLARAAYESRRDIDGTIDPANLLVLSDALEEAGCVNHILLDHLRSVSPHVRGCWAVDLILGKE